MRRLREKRREQVSVRRQVSPWPKRFAAQRTLFATLHCAAFPYDRQFAGFRLGAGDVHAMRLFLQCRRPPEVLDDLHDYCQPAPRRRCGHCASADESSVVVTDDWPAMVPIGKSEVRIFEGYLRKELDELFGPLP